ncbi:uncharacterized protein BDZ99DRAFT_515735 [Mytilinidion resinicola]|uniref:Uncharacterized protein n=1 Tax=Mytilinidion resinicola TaxID=574789 RepID=A0A6A6Z1D1_9PEZI|nr:uncharacterized protein BDZ99DRAFT_515735 [Mytilinidion resinicola]KAF2814972.1 hypothetical protein BDZ99DRAFT_515735 [Mytilinidion resinicola]
MSNLSRPETLSNPHETNLLIRHLFATLIIRTVSHCLDLHLYSSERRRDSKSLRRNTLWRSVDTKPLTHHRERLEELTGALMEHLEAFKSISRLKPYRETVECYSIATIVGTESWSSLEEDVKKTARCNFGRAMERGTVDGLFCYHCERIHRLVKLDPGQLRDHYTLCKLKQLSIQDPAAANQYLRVMMERMGLSCNHILRMPQWDAYWKHLSQTRLVINPLFSPQKSTQLLPCMPLEMRSGAYVIRPVSIPQSVPPARPLQFYEIHRVTRPQERFPRAPTDIRESSRPLRLQPHSRSDSSDASSIHSHDFSERHHRGRRVIASLKGFKQFTTRRRPEKASASESHEVSPDARGTILKEFCLLRNSSRLEDRTKDMRVMRDIMWFRERKAWQAAERYSTDAWSSDGAGLPSRGPPWFILTL